MEGAEQQREEGGACEPSVMSEVTEEEVEAEDAVRNWNHAHGDDVTSPPAEAAAAAAEISPETEQSEEPAAAAPQEAQSGTVVVPGNNRMAASERLQRVRKWSITKYKSTRQALSERLGRGSRTVDLELEPRLELLRDDRQRYDHMTRLAQTLANQLAQLTVTQKNLGDVFAELSLKTPPLHVEFGVNADSLRFVAKSGETLTAAVNEFTADVNTLVNKTIEDVMINAKQYEAARIEYDAFRCDLEELNLGPRDTGTLPKLEQAQRDFQDQRDKYQRTRDDLSVKLKLLQENKVKVLHNQLWLLHGAVASHATSCHQFLQQGVQKVATHAAQPGVDAPSWLEDS
ncbi:arfaptin-1-like [Myripristis murdjan]|uniref:Arfaptin-1-like n=1 Tax=Myripristis murdjan TaxID=586833 RepID=A0A667Z5U6_9TELE|nr:arfaptin-1-like [Myripristis murdjan]